MFQCDIDICSVRQSAAEADLSGSTPQGLRATLLQEAALQESIQAMYTEKPYVTH